MSGSLFDLQASDSYAQKVKTRISALRQPLSPPKARSGSCVAVGLEEGFYPWSPANVAHHQLLFGRDARCGVVAKEAVKIRSV